jgi:hypothetical protein
VARQRPGTAGTMNARCIGEPRSLQDPDDVRLGRSATAPPAAPASAWRPMISRSAAKFYRHYIALALERSGGVRSSSECSARLQIVIFVKAALDEAGRRANWRQR